MIESNQCGKPKRLSTPIAQFDALQIMMRTKPRSDAVADLFRLLTLECFEYLQVTERKNLLTAIPNKQYFAFTLDGKMSRAVNQALFYDVTLVEKFLTELKGNRIATTLSSSEITAACYMIVVSLACTVDLYNPGDRQTPGTYFQYLVTHLLTRDLNVAPSERVRVEVGLDVNGSPISVPLTMDLILDLGDDKPKYHVAIKTSTRERASEFWAHQRILDQAFPTQQYVGIFVGLAETKVDSRTFVVTEICVPDQWRAYQRYISMISNIYYLDPPLAYLNLNGKTPMIRVEPFGNYFFRRLVDGTSFLNTAK